jgi:hypothetical protein
MNEQPDMADATWTPVTGAGSVNAVLTDEQARDAARLAASVPATWKADSERRHAVAALLASHRELARRLAAVERVAQSYESSKGEVADDCATVGRILRSALAGDTA